MERDHIILDFGKVIAGPGKNGWFIPPRYADVLNLTKEQLEILKETIEVNDSYLQEKMITEADECICFRELYRNALTIMNYNATEDEMDRIVEYLADDWVYNDKKFSLYPNIKEELEYLVSKYKLLMLTDNWPSVLRIMENQDLKKYFERIYVSSIYDCDKKGQKFFLYPIKDFKLEDKKTMFVDDTISNLKVAESLGLTSILMDRDNESPKVKYKKIKSLYEL